MLACLETVILNELGADLPEVGCHTEETLNQIALRLSAICAYPKLCTRDSEIKSTHVMRYPIVQILMSRDLTVATLRNLSREAFIYYVTEGQSASTGELKDDGTCLPGPEIAMKFLEAWELSTAMVETTFDFSQGRKDLVESISQEDLKPLLEMVDLASIHPELLVAVIEPLNMIDPVVLTAALRVQAVRSSRLLRIVAKENVSNIWYFLDPGDELWRKPTNDKLTLSVTMRRESPSFKVTAVAGVQIGPGSSWEILVTPHGLRTVRYQTIPSRHSEFVLILKVYVSVRTMILNGLTQRVT